MKTTTKMFLTGIMLLGAVGAVAFSQQQPPPPVLSPPPQASQQAQPQPPRLQTPPKAVAQPEQEKPQVFRSTVYQVAMPVTFFDAKGEVVTDIERNELNVFDKGTVQRIDSFDVAFKPISMVILVDISDRMEGVIPDLRTTGVLFTQLVLGETGEAAVLTYDREVEVKQEFTTNGDLIEKAIKGLRSGQPDARMTDGVYRGLGMLQNRPEDRRRVLVVLAEGRDLGSELKKNQALREAQLANVSIYSVEFSSFQALRRRPLPGTTVDPFPAGSRGSEPGVPPGTNTGVNGLQLWPAITESVRAGKALLWAHPMKTYAGGTGSEHITAHNIKGVEEAVQKIARDVHNQYWLAYTPNNLGAEEFHNIEVRVNRPTVKARARPGYFYVPSGGEMPDPGKKK